MLFRISANVVTTINQPTGTVAFLGKLKQKFSSTLLETEKIKNKWRINNRNSLKNLKNNKKQKKKRN